MNCFLHIGTEKTATTTIQKFLDINRYKLIEKGFFYTKTAGMTNNQALSVAAYNLSRRDDFTKRHGLNSDDELLIFQKQIIRNLTKEITKFKKNNFGSTIIFSSEHIQSRLTDVKELEKLREIIYNLGVTNITVVVYLRRPADIANSLYSTSLKSGNYEDEPLSPQNSYWNNVCNHKNTIKKFSYIFGKSAIVPRLFDKNELINGSIIDDFLNVIGTSIDNQYYIPDNLNKGLSATGINLLKRLNKTIPMWVDNKPNPIRQNLVLYIEKHFSDSTYVMPRFLYEEYDLEFQESNDWVRDQYFSDKKNIFSNEIPKEATATIPEAELEKISSLITDIWNDKQNKINELKLVR